MHYFLLYVRLESFSYKTWLQRTEPLRTVATGDAFVVGWWCGWLGEVEDEDDDDDDARGALLGVGGAL